MKPESPGSFNMTLKYKLIFQSSFSLKCVHPATSFPFHLFKVSCPFVEILNLLSIITYIPLKSKLYHVVISSGFWSQTAWT